MDRSLNREKRWVRGFSINFMSAIKIWKKCILVLNMDLLIIVPYLNLIKMIIKSINRELRKVNLNNF